jgi:hypothetical protein
VFFYVDGVTEFLDRRACPHSDTFSRGHEVLSGRLPRRCSLSNQQGSKCNIWMINTLAMEQHRPCVPFGVRITLLDGLSVPIECSCRVNFHEIPLREASGKRVLCFRRPLFGELKEAPVVLHLCIDIYIALGHLLPPTFLGNLAVKLDPGEHGINNKHGKTKSNNFKNKLLSKATRCNKKPDNCN